MLLLFWVMTDQASSVPTTRDGLTLESREVLPSSPEFAALTSQLHLPPMSLCVGLSLLHPWLSDVTAFTALQKKEASSCPASRLLFYRPSASVDLHDVQQYGFPPSDHETWIEGPLAVEGGAVVLSERCPPVANSGPTSFLVCDFLAGERVLDCEAQNVLHVDRPALDVAQCDVLQHRSTGVWATFQKERVLLRYLVRLVPRPPPVEVDPDLFAVFRAPEDAMTVRVVAGASDGGAVLQHAISRAPDFATLVLEGVFREAIVLGGKNLRLVGAGDRSVLQAPADGAGQNRSRPTTVVRMTGPFRFVLEGLTIKANKRRDGTGGALRDLLPEWSECNADVKAFKKPKRRKDGGAGGGGGGAGAQAALIDQGRCANCLEVSDGVLNALVVDCALNGGAEVSSGAAAYFRDCSIHDGVVNGVYVNGAKILMERCVVARHDSANVAVEHSSSAYFIECRVFGSRSTGVYLFNGGSAVFERCEFFANAQTALQVEGATTDPVVRNCRIHHGSQYGMFLTSGCAGTIECNAFYANVWAAVATTEGGSPLVRYNNVFRGLHYGLYSFDSGKGRFESNFVHHNKDAGLAVASGAAPEITGCEFYANLSYGCYFFLKGAGRVQNCRICSNQAANVCITYGSEPTVCKNRIYSGQADGVMLMQEGRGVVEGNEIFSNYENNVLLQFDAAPVIRGNRIYSAKKAGVCFLHNAKGELLDNEIFGCDYSGVSIKTDANPIVRGNSVHDNKRFAVLVQMRGKGVVTGNRFAANTMGSVRVWRDSHPTLSDNTFDAREKTETKLETDPATSAVTTAAAAVALPAPGALAPTRPVPLPPAPAAAAAATADAAAVAVVAAPLKKVPAKKSPSKVAAAASADVGLPGGRPVLQEGMIAGEDFESASERCDDF